MNTEQLKAELAREALALLVARPALARRTGTHSAVKSAARAERESMLARAEESKTDRADRAAGFAAGRAELIRELVTRKRMLVAERNALAPMAKARALQSKLGTTPELSASQSQRDARRVEVIAIELDDIARRLSALFSQPIEWSDMQDGGKLIRRAIWHRFSVGMTAADYGDIVGEALVLALVEIRSGKRAPVKNHRGELVPTVGHVMGKLQWAYRAELSRFRNALRAGTVRVHSLDALQELGGDVLESHIHSLEAYGYADAPDETAAILSGLVDADAPSLFAMMERDIVEAKRGLDRARIARNHLAIDAAAAKLAGLESALHRYTIEAARERAAVATRAHRLARVDAMPDGSPTDERTKLALRFIVRGLTVADTAEALGLRPSTVLTALRALDLGVGQSSPRNPRSGESVALSPARAVIVCDARPAGEHGPVVVTQSADRRRVVRAARERASNADRLALI